MHNPYESIKVLSAWCLNNIQMLTILQNEVSKYTKYHYFEPNTWDYSA
jgi:hypothetical protein